MTRIRLVLIRAFCLHQLRPAQTRLKQGYVCCNFQWIVPKHRWRAWLFWRWIMVTDFGVDHYTHFFWVSMSGQQNAHDYSTGSHGKNISRGRMQMCVSRMSQNVFDGCSTKVTCAAALFTCFMDASSSDMMLFWQSSFISQLCSRGTTTVISASAAFCSVEWPLEGYRWGCWDELLVVPTLTRRRHPVRQHRALLLFSPPSNLCERLWVYLPWLFSPLSASDRRGSSSTCAAHWCPVKDTGGKGPLSMTASAPTLDTASGLGAVVSRLLLALQTSQILALTGQVCGEKVSPDAVLTSVPSSTLFTFRCWHLLREREEGRIKQESQTPALPDVVNANAEELRQTSGALGAAKSWLELDHSWGRFSGVNTHEYLARTI